MTKPRSHICKDLNPGSPTWMVLHGCWEDVRTLNPLVSALDPTAGPSPPPLWSPGAPWWSEKPLRPHLRHGHTWDRWVPLKARGPAAGEPTRTGGSRRARKSSLSPAASPPAAVGTSSHLPLSATTLAGGAQEGTGPGILPQRTRTLGEGARAVL